MRSTHLPNSPRELVLIGGAYKSGTSRLCEILEAGGYVNPAALTNPMEHGHGIRVRLYQTRECSIARQFNRELLAAGSCEQIRIERNLGGYLADMWEMMGDRLVVKDPCMKLTAPHWFRVARSLGTTRIVFLHTEREPHEILRSWANSQFLTREQRLNPERFSRLLAPIAPTISEQLLGLEVTTTAIPYSHIAHAGSAVPLQQFANNLLSNRLARAS